jgi:hypothetical protein
MKKEELIEDKPYVRSSSGATAEQIAQKRQRISEILNKEPVAEPRPYTPPRYDDIYWDAIETWDKEATGTDEQEKR